VSDSFAAHGQLVSIRQELDVARRMQQAILPSAFPPHAAVDLAARMIPALEVGGDFYDFFWLDRTRLGLVIADVSDKGVGAALFMAVSRTLLRAVAPGAAGPAACLGAASNILAEDNPASMFVTVFYGVLDVETGELVYASGGHPPPLVVSTSGEVAPLPRTRGAALGMFPDQRLEERQAALPAGASLFLYTDGVTEATAPDGSEFGSARLAAALAAQPPDAMLAALLGAVEGFVAGRPRADDVTCMVVRRRSHAAA
jgi:sigma-B regulation protein RsbU (phosphoserine phosphatase)